MSNFILTREQLAQLLPGNPYLDHWYHALELALPDYDINTPQRVAAFVAQCAHESGGFRALKENLNYKAATLRKIFPKYFPDDATANHYAKKPLPIVSTVDVWAMAQKLVVTDSVTVGVD
jgi:putative chitinase